ETGLAAEVCGRELVERDAVAKARPPLRVWGGGQEAKKGVMAGAHLRVRQAGDDREVVAELPEHVQVRRRRVVPPRPPGEQGRGVQPEGRADADHAPRRWGGGARRPGAGHGVEPGQGQGDARGAKEVTAVELHGKVLVRGDFIGPAPLSGAERRSARGTYL